MVVLFDTSCQKHKELLGGNKHARISKEKTGYHIISYIFHNGIKLYGTWIVFIINHRSHYENCGGASCSFWCNPAEFFNGDGFIRNGNENHGWGYWYCDCLWIKSTATCIVF